MKTLLLNLVFYVLCGNMFYASVLYGEGPQRPPRRVLLKNTPTVLQPREMLTLKSPSLDEIFSNQVPDAFTGLFSPYSLAVEPNQIGQRTAFADFFDGCRNLSLVFQSHEYSNRWLQALEKVRTESRQECLRRAGRVLKYLLAEGKLTQVQVFTLRNSIVGKLPATEALAFTEYAKKVNFHPPSPNSPGANHDVYVELPSGVYDFLQKDPRYPKLLFGDHGIYQKSEEGYAQILQTDKANGRLTAEGYLADAQVHEDLVRWLKDSTGPKPSAQDLEEQALLSTLLLPGLKGETRAKNLQNIVQDLLALRKEDRAGHTKPAQTGLALQKVVDYLHADESRADDLHHLEWSLTKFSSVPVPPNACELVCSLFSPVKYEKWKISDETNLAKSAVGSIDFAFLSLQARFALEALVYCPNTPEVKKVYDQIIPKWVKSRTDGENNQLKGDRETFNPYKSYAKSFSILFDRRYQTLYSLDLTKDRQLMEKLLNEDLVNPKLNQDHKGGSNLGNTTFHLAFNTIAAPRESASTQKAVQLLQRIVDTCRNVTGNAYQIPYRIDRLENGDISPQSCLRASSMEDGAAARAVAIFLALYLKTDFVSPEHREVARRNLEGALENFYVYAFDLKSHVTGNHLHWGRSQKAPYFWYAGLAAAATALAILERDFPQDHKKYAESKKALLFTAWDLWDTEKGLFESHGDRYLNSNQYNQPLSGLSMFGLGVCKIDGRPSFALADSLLDIPHPDTLELFKGRHGGFDTRKLHEAGAAVPHQKNTPSLRGL